MAKKYKLMDERSSYKPFVYDWAFKAYKESEQMHWLAEEVPMLEDVKDWKNNLKKEEKEFLTHIFRFFVQSDIDVAGGYISDYLPRFKHPEIRMMLCSFVAREAVHIHAYSHLIETLGMPETTYNEFLNYDAMKNKHEFFKNFTDASNDAFPIKIALISAFTEGVALFSSFVMLLNFARFGKMKGMAQIISWSIADEAVVKGTEVLTKNGWKNIEDLVLGEEVYEYSMEMKQTSFQPIQKIKHVIRDESYIFQSDTAYQHVSPNHRMIIENDDGTIGEVKAKDFVGDETLILNGEKQGKDKLSNLDKVYIKEVVSGKRPVNWIYDQIPKISSLWAKEAVEFYLELKNELYSI